MEYPLTKGGKLGMKIRNKSKGISDAFLVLLYAAIFLFLMSNKKAATTIIMASRLLKSLEIIITRASF